MRIATPTTAIHTLIDINANAMPDTLRANVKVDSGHIWRANAKVPQAHPYPTWTLVAAGVQLVCQIKYMIFIYLKGATSQVKRKGIRLNANLYAQT
jgi:hypothetical protein